MFPRKFFLRVPHMQICTPTPEEAHSLIWPDKIIMEAIPTDNEQSGNT